MIDHCSLGVSDLARSMAFYDALLAPLGAVRLWNDLDAAGYGRPGNDDAFAIKRSGEAIAPNVRAHLAFTASTRAAVDAFHAAALRCGGTSDGEPGLHPEYGPGYYASFVTDPDGHRLEAVRHETQAAES